MTDAERELVESALDTTESELFDDDDARERFLRARRAVLLERVKPEELERWRAAWFERARAVEKQEDGWAGVHEDIRPELVDRFQREYVDEADAADREERKADGVEHPRGDTLLHFRCATHGEHVRTSNGGECLTCGADCFVEPCVGGACRAKKAERKP